TVRRRARICRRHSRGRRGGVGVSAALSGAGFDAVRGLPPAPRRPARVLLLRDVLASAEDVSGVAETGRGGGRAAGGQAVQSAAAARRAPPPPARQRQRTVGPPRLPPRRPAAVDRLEGV